MAMPDFSQPRRLLLLQSCQAALRRITKANGYPWDTKAQNVVLDPFNILSAVSDCTDSPLFVVEPTDQGDLAFQPARVLKEDFVATISARIDAKGADPDRRMKVGLQLAGVVEHALVQDLSRGGLCVDTRVMKPQIFSALSEDNPVVVVVQVHMKYRRQYGDPT